MEGMDYQPYAKHVVEVSFSPCGPLSTLVLPTPSHHAHRQFLQQWIPSRVPEDVLEQRLHTTLCAGVPVRAQGT